MTSENNWFGEVLAARTSGNAGPDVHTASSALRRTGTWVFGVAVGANLRPDSPRTQGCARPACGPRPGYGPRRRRPPV